MDKLKMSDVDGREIKVGDTVMIHGRNLFKVWAPEGFNAGVVIELNSKAWLGDGHVTIQFSDGCRFCYEPGQLVKVRM